MSRLRVAIVHYHLKRGGVTKVIESTIRGFKSLGTNIDFAILTGHLPATFPYSEQAVEVEGLHYSNLQETTPDPKDLVEKMKSAAAAILGSVPDIWHIHNHSLGKNHSIPGVVSLLAQSGERMLLHMHDFAEDGRPANFRVNKEIPEYSGQLYPDGDNVHYGFINNRDRGLFASCGFPQERLHYLGNPVDSSKMESAGKATETIRGKLHTERLFLYPVRAVRRKNFGEMLLWSALAGAGDVFATTLGPTNKDFVEEYEKWKRFAAECGLPVQFEIGEGNDWNFHDIIAASDYIITTSVAEGFGLTFLEPLQFGKCILGRDLPEITADFKDLGLQLNHLYRDIPIPTTWLDMDELKSTLQRELDRTYRAYDTMLTDDMLDRAMASITPLQGYVDFGGLNEDLQRSVIRKLAEEPECRNQIPFHKLLPTNLSNQGNTRLQRFRPEAYCSCLHDIYMNVSSISAQSSSFFPPNTVLEQFLRPERFRLLRT